MDIVDMYICVVKQKEAVISKTFLIDIKTFQENLLNIDHIPDLS